MSLARTLTAASAFAALFTASVAAQAEVPIKLEPFVTGVNTPLAMVQPEGDDRIFVIEQFGRVRIVRDGQLEAEPFLDIRNLIPQLWKDFDERGLLGLAFHPKFKDNGRFYVAYSAHLDFQGDLGKQFWWDHTNVVAEYTVSADDPDVADPKSGRSSPRSTGRSSTTTATGSASARTACSTSRPATAAMPTTGASATT